MASSAVAGSTDLTGTVTLNMPAPPEGIWVTLNAPTKRLQSREGQSFCGRIQQEFSHPNDTEEQQTNGESRRAARLICEERAARRASRRGGFSLPET